MKNKQEQLTTRTYEMDPHFFGRKENRKRLAHHTADAGDMRSESVTEFFTQSISGRLLVRFVLVRSSYRIVAAKSAAEH